MGSSDLELNGEIPCGIFARFTKKAFQNPVFIL